MGVKTFQLGLLSDDFIPPPKKKKKKKNKKKKTTKNKQKKKKKKCPILVKAKLSYWNGLICLIFCQHFKSNYFFLFLLQHSLSDVVLSWKRPRWFLLILRCWYRMHLIPNHNVIDVEVLTSGSVYVPVSTKIPNSLTRLLLPMYAEC